MVSLMNLENSTNRRRCNFVHKKHITAILTAVIVLGLFVSIITLVIYSMQPAPFTPSTPFKTTLEQGKEHFNILQATIQHRLEIESPSQKDSLEKFQQEQLILAQHYHQTHGHRLSSLLNSVYTPTPIFVPEVDYLMTLHGSCHPLNPSLSRTDRDLDSNFNNVNDNSSNTNSVCYPCNQNLINKYSNTTLSIDMCEMIPQVALYECDNTSDNTDSELQRTIKVIPCSSAYVDGTSQFWAIYAISTILILVSSVAVRKRFDKAQDKVMKRINKTLHR